ncbi:MAG: hypothetical protein ACN6OC_10865 [Alcaligenes sp.]
MTAIESPAPTAEEARKLRAYVYMLAKTTQAFADAAGIDLEATELVVAVDGSKKATKSIRSILDDALALAGE